VPIGADPQRMLLVPVRGAVAWQTSRKDAGRTLVETRLLVQYGQVAARIYMWDTTTADHTGELVAAARTLQHKLDRILGSAPNAT
jgi:hypothetical protein